MNKSILVSIVCAVLGGITVAVLFLAVNTQAEPSRATTELEKSLAQVTADLRQVRQRLDALEVQPAVTPRAEVASSATAPAPAPAASQMDHSPATATAAVPASQPFANELQSLVASGYTPDAMKTFFDRVRQSKAQEAAIAAIKAKLVENASDPRTHYLLAKAYEERLMVESSPAGFEHWGKLVMAEYDAALALDAKYWEPRFERAKSLSYYPEAEGKTPQAIRDFETLLEQQNRSTRDARFAHSYAMLARLYLRVGKKQKAEATLTEALALFPDDAELRQQLEVIKGE